jgi:tetratricopeptide (TPR) repeat protein
MPIRPFVRRAPWFFVFATLAVFPAATRGQTPPATAAHSQEAVVIEQSRARLRFESDGTAVRQMYVRARAQTDAGVQQFGQLAFGYNAANERLEIMFIRVRKPDESTIETPASSVQDLSSPVERVAPIYTDFRQKHATVQGLRPGDTIEFDVVTTVHTPLAPGQFWSEYTFNTEAIVLDEQLEIDVPSGKRITLKTRPGFDPQVQESGGRRLHRWTRSNLTRAKDDETEEKEKDKEKESDESRTAPVRLTTFESWEQVGRWYAALEASQRTPTAEIRAKAAALTAGRTSDLEKLAALYEFVATQFRYVSLSLGLGRYQPRAAGDVLREQYGDCKDKHTLLASLIEAAGLRASAALINSSAKLDPSFPSPSQFDHVITKTRAGDEDVWVDTTAEVAPFRLLPLPLRNKQALVIDAQGAPRLEETPADPPMKSFLQQVIEATMAEAGSLETRVQLSMRGDVELGMRVMFRSLPPADWKTMVERMLAIAGDRTGKVSNLKVSDPTALKDPFRVEFDASFEDYASWQDGKATVPLPLTGTTSAEDPETESGDTIKLGAAPTEVTYRFKLTLPPGVTARAPVAVSVARDYAEYRSSYTVEGSSFSAARTFLISRSELPGERRADHDALLRVIRADARQTVALQTAAGTTSTVKGDLKAIDLNRKGYAALKAGNYSEAITILTRVVELEPKDKTAWNNLGRAYMALRQPDSAIDAFQKQIEVNPYDAFAYNYLGAALLSQQKFDAAETALRKQLEINPLDEYAPASLGGLLVDRRRHKDALPFLEKAITLNPKNAWLQIQLGKAHLNLKQEDEAVAAFDRAVELSPTPGSWNDIAYELSLTGTRLDRALQYAESAVASTTAASRNLDLARADNASYGVVSSLAAYWDTLGWVHYARGDLARAEPLLEAAWRLGQHAEVGDHLAQLYEKTGRRDAAIRTYAMALSAQRPTDEIRGRLARMLGDNHKVDAAVARHREELLKARTVQLGASEPRGKRADLVILFSSTGGVEGVRFLSGDEAVRPLVGKAEKVSYGVMFPDATTPAKLLRRGIVACPPLEGECTITLLLPEDAVIPPTPQ